MRVFEHMAWPIRAKQIYERRHLNSTLRKSTIVKTLINSSVAQKMSLEI